MENLWGQTPLIYQNIYESYNASKGWNGRHLEPGDFTRAFILNLGREADTFWIHGAVDGWIGGADGTPDYENPASEGSGLVSRFFTWSPKVTR